MRSLRLYTTGLNLSTFLKFTSTKTDQGLVVGLCLETGRTTRVAEYTVDMRAPEAELLEYKAEKQDMNGEATEELFKILSSK